MMKALSFVLLMALLCFYNCGRNELSLTTTPSEWGKDTVVNTAFCYLPDTCIIDKDLYAFAANLIDIERIYTDSTTNIECYKEWFNNTSSQGYCDLYRDRDIEIDSCIMFIRNHIIPEIRRNGTNCTAAIAETAWLEFGINQYLAFSEFELRALEAGANFCTWWLAENDAWLNFMTNLFPLLDYEICNVTGSSAAYEIPYIFSNISKFRTKYLAENTADSTTDNNTSLNTLLSLIEEINPEKFDCEQNRMVENVGMVKHKKCAVETLLSWIEVRNGMAELVDNPNRFNNATTTLIDSISTTIYHIRH